MSREKRPASESFSSGQLVKRPRADGVNGTGTNGTLIQSGGRGGALDAPVMELSGHSGEVFATRFDPIGQNIASGSMDRSIMLWRAHGDCNNYGVMTGHKGAVLDLHWSRDSRVLYSVSADATVASWDTETGQRVRRHEGHENVVNTLDVTRRGSEILVSGSDDGCIGLWDPRQKYAIDFIESDLPVTAVALAEAGNEIYQGGIDNDIKVWDIRKKEVEYSMKGHTDTITSLQLSPDSQTLLSNSSDSTVRTWDIKPFAPINRHLKTYDGAASGMEKNLLKATWDTTGQRIAAGNGEQPFAVVIWEARTGKLLHKLPGHAGAVNDVRFSPTSDSISKEIIASFSVWGPKANTAVVLSGSTDKNILLGELGK